MREGLGQEREHLVQEEEGQVQLTTWGRRAVAVAVAVVDVWGGLAGAYDPERRRASVWFPSGRATPCAPPLFMPVPNARFPACAEWVGRGGARVCVRCCCVLAKTLFISQLFEKAGKKRYKSVDPKQELNANRYLGLRT